MKKIKHILICGFMSLALLTLIVGLVGVLGLVRLNHNAQSIENTTDLRYHASLLQTILYRQERNYLLLYEGEEIAEQVFAALDGEFLATLAHLQASNTYPELEAPLAEIAQVYVDQSTPACLALGEAILQDDVEAIMQHMAAFIGYADFLINDAQTVIDLANAHIDDLVGASVRYSQGLSLTLALLGLLVLAQALLIGLRMAKRLSQPIEKLTQAAESLANGNIRVDVAVQAKNELGTLSAAFQRMINGISRQADVLEQIAHGDYTQELAVRSQDDVINRAIGNLVHSTNAALQETRLASRQVAQASRQISQGAQDLASGSSQQAASVAQLSGILREIDHKTQKNAVATQSALELNQQAQSQLQRSRESMKALLQAMRTIDSSAQNITKINHTIEDIAFQTNILSLNASVEAARAGIHGKGFAVVANEVRRLAAHSSAAAQETAQLVEAAIHEVQSGNRLVRQTNAELDTVSETTQSFSALLQNVAQDSQEQAQEIATISNRLEEISQVTQGNCATAEQSASAAAELSAQARVLDATVAHFLLEEQTLPLEPPHTPLPTDPPRLMLLH